MAETEKNSIQQFIQVFKAMPNGKKASFGLVVVTLVGGFIALFLWANRPDFQVLFANLDAADAGRITEKLREQKIPYQLKEGGSAIMVPREKVYQLRLELASEGIPRGHNVGFEIFDNLPFSTTEFVQKLKYKQALQGELARTIMEFDAVDQARVHIVTSGDSLFAEPEKPATASVVLRLHPGRSLDQRQMQGIINLVARAVEGLKPENVTLVDMSRGLLSKGYPGGDGADALSRAQFEYQQKIERNLEHRIQTMLESVVGMNRVVARVSAEVDFERVKILEERFDPDSSVIRSEQKEKEVSSDQSGYAAGSPDLQAQVYKSSGTVGVGGGSSGKSFQKENSVINYEINKIQRQVMNSVGEIKRLSVAVIVDGPYVSEKGPDGKTIQKFVPRSRREMKTFEDIVKKAMGFRSERGDQVSVTNIPFAIQTEEVALVGNGSPWLDYARKATKPLFNIFLIALFFLFAVRPFKRWLKNAGESIFVPSLPQGEGVPQLSEQAGEAADKTGEKKRTAEITASNPDMAAQVIRAWLHEGR